MGYHRTSSFAEGTKQSGCARRCHDREIFEQSGESVPAESTHMQKVRISTDKSSQNAQKCKKRVMVNL